MTRRWLTSAAGALAAGALVAGLLGLGEALSQRLRFGPLPELPAASLPRVLLPPFALYGWFGLVIAAIAFPAAALVGRRLRRPRRFAWSAAVAAAAAAVLAIWLAYLLRERLAVDWWAAHAAADKVVVVAFGLIVIGLSTPLIFRLSAAAARLPAWTAALPLLPLIGATAPWPFWLAQIEQMRTAGLPRATAPAGAPSVVLITIDAWRRDHLSASQPQSPPTPNLDALAAAGARCTNAWTSSPWTLPAVGSLMTGLPARALRVDPYLPLPPAVPLLAQMAWRQGWDTAAFLTNPYLSPWYGFDRGFAAYEHAMLLEPLLPAQRGVLAREIQRFGEQHYEAARGERVIAKATRWLDRHDRRRPFFLWIHLLDPHVPYTWRDLPAGALAGNAGIPPDRSAVPDTGCFRGGSFKIVRDVRRGLWRPDAAARAAIQTLYAREVQYADAMTGRLLHELKRRGLWDRTLIVVTADHGEELFDHGGLEHGHSLLPEVTGIPLVARFPAGQREGTVVTQAVSLLDLLPTLCDAAGWQAPAGLPGRDLGPLLRGEPAAAVAATGPPLLIENLLYGSQRRGVLAWPWLCILPAEGEAGARQWYDLTASPDAAAAVPAPADGDSLLAAAARLTAAADSTALCLRSESAGRAKVPEHVQRQLRSLGY